MMVLANFRSGPVTLQLPSGVKKVLLDNMDLCEISGDRIALKGWQAAVAELTSE